MRAVVGRSPTPAWVAPTALAVTVAGFAVSAWLLVDRLSAGTALACPDTGVVSCARVTTSDQSVMFGVPLPVLGLAFFAVMLALNVPAAWRSPSPAIRQGRMVAAVVGVVMVLYLVYVELFIVDAVCLWCTAVHVLTLTLFGVVAVATARLAQR